jgi:hypothetical protein
MTLHQEYDTAALLESVRLCIESGNRALDQSGSGLAMEYSDIGLADLQRYWKCRDEGMDEPYCTEANYDTTDSFMTDAESTLQGIFDMADCIANNHTI